MLLGLLVGVLASDCAGIVGAPRAFETEMQSARDTQFEPNPAAFECHLQYALDAAETDLERAEALQLRMVSVMRSGDWTLLPAIVEEGLGLTSDDRPEAAALRQQFLTGQSLVRAGEGDIEGADAAARGALLASAMSMPESWQVFPGAYRHRATGLVCADDGEARLVSLESEFSDWVRCTYRIGDETMVRMEAWLPDPADPDGAEAMLPYRVEGEPRTGPIPLYFHGLDVFAATFPDRVTGQDQKVWFGQIGPSAGIAIASFDQSISDRREGQVHALFASSFRSMIAGSDLVRPNEDLFTMAIRAAQERYMDATRTPERDLPMLMALGYARTAVASAPDSEDRARAERLHGEITTAIADWRRHGLLSEEIFGPDRED